MTSTTTTPMADLGLTPSLVAGLAARDITQAFDIQAKAIPPALEGRDVCGRAPTGSGKTLAFGIPVVERVTEARPGRPKALILTPTRELAAQIGDELKLLIGSRRIRVATFYGGVGFGPQLSALRRGVEVAVACPGRLADLVRRGDVRLDEVELVVLDEADRMADMGFLPEVRRLLDAVRPDRQTLLFSATLDGDIDVLVRHYQRNPVRCAVEPRHDHVDRTTHTFLPVSREARTKTAAALVAEHGTTVVFTRTKRGADRVARQLANAGLASVAIHGGRSQRQRDRALSDFTDGRAQVLVATDVAARGIHVDDVRCVIHYDLAGDHKDYVHRSGRTGRAGARGTVVSLVTAEDSAQAASLQRDLGMAPARSEERRARGSRPGAPAAGGTRSRRRRRGSR
ncbi:MAG: DEAD/DEAH box helicase [Actinobacteria bacterium]|nr:MAG: DEAD/DEAH box helicase [Actinomycetota bacterium]